MIPKEKIKEIIEAVSIVDIISKDIDLKRNGTSLIGLCSFHDDTNPSLSISPSKNIFKCWSCGVGGNVIDYLKLSRNMNFLESMNYLSNLTGISIPHKNLNYTDNTEVYNLYKKTAEYYKNNLATNKEYLYMLLNRKLSLRTISYFNLGVAFQDLLTKLNKREIDIAHQYRLLNKASDDFFNNRIVIPIYDIHNNIVAFNGRTYTNNSVKYLLSGSSRFFDKSKLLYNLNNSYEHIRKSDNVYLFEGCFDLFAAFNLGIENTCCCLGSNLTEHQARLLKNYTRNIVLVFDSDEAGYNATLRTLILLENYDFNVSILLLPKGYDFSSLVTHGNYTKETIKDYINKFLVNSYDWLFRFLKKDLNIKLTENKIAYCNKIMNEIKKFNSAIKRNLLIDKLSETTGISKNELLKDL